MTGTLALLRRWVEDYFNDHDAEAARAFCAPDYTLSIGDVVFAGRDTAWLPAVDVQMKAYPDLAMTVHQTLAGEGWAAVWFSEHGSTDGRAAVWSGVGIYRSDGTMLTGCVAQEDYMTRRRQLKSGVADPVDPAADAPWDTPVGPHNRAAEAAVLEWVRGGWPRPETGVICDDNHITGEALKFDVARTEVGEMLSSGNHVAFNIRQSGIYLGGLPTPTPRDASETLDVNGLVKVENGKVTTGRIIRDRMGLFARLRAAA